jgi:hypothetical protein
MFSLRGSPVYDIEIVLAHNRLEVALVDDEQWNFGIELSKVADLTVLFRDKSLGKHGQLDEEMVLREIEVGPESAHGYAMLVPGEWEFEGLVDPLVTVEREELREDSLTGVGEGLG